MPTLTPEAVWRERLRWRLDPDTFDARARGLAHELLATASGRAVPEERIETETRRVLDELGVWAGIGPMPW
jgi:hypothetical protein